MSFLNFKNKDITEVIKEAQRQNPFAYTYLIEKYRGIVIHLINKKNLFLTSNGNRDDLIQEGLIGLHKAIENYKSELGPFESYAYIVVYGHLITAIKSSNRYKHQVLNNSSSLDVSLDDNENLTMSDLISNREDVRYNYGTKNPEEQLMEEEMLKFYSKELYKSLSDMERKVFELYIDNKSYSEITSILNINSKKVDNTLQRIKKKIRDVILLDDERIKSRKNNRLII